MSIQIRESRSHSGSQVVCVKLYQAARHNTCLSPGRVLRSPGWKSCHKTVCCVISMCVCVCAQTLSKGSGFYPVSVLCSHSVERAVKGTLFPHGADREPLQHTGEMERERPSVSAGVGWGVIELVEADGCGEGPSMCTSASHNISALAGPTI